MREYYCKEVYKPSDILLLLKYIDTDELNDEYWTRMIENIYNSEYVIIGIYRLISCKTCIVKYKPEMLGFINAKWHQDDNELDVLTLSLDTGCNYDNELGIIIGKYLEKISKQLGIKRIKFHSKLRPKEWYEEFLGLKFDEYRTYVWG